MLFEGFLGYGKPATVFGTSADCDWYKSSFGRGSLYLARPTRLSRLPLPTGGTTTAEFRAREEPRAGSAAGTIDTGTIRRPADHRGRGISETGAQNIGLRFRANLWYCTRDVDGSTGELRDGRAGCRSRATPASDVSFASRFSPDSEDYGHRHARALLTAHPAASKTASNSCAPG